MSGVSVSEEERFARTVKVLSEAIVYSVTKIHEKEPQQAAEKGIVTPGMAQLISTIANSLDQKYQIDTFVKHTYKFWDQIRRKDREFFVSHAGNIFVPLQVTNIKMSIFMDIVDMRDSSGQPVIHADIEEEIWNLFHAMVKIALKYVHRRRSPYRRASAGGGETRGYQESYMAEIDLHQMIEDWGVKVVWPEIV